MNLTSFWYLKKWFLLDFIATVAPFGLLEFVSILFGCRKIHAVGFVFLKILLYNMPIVYYILFGFMSCFVSV